MRLGFARCIQRLRRSRTSTPSRVAAGTAAAADAGLRRRRAVAVVRLTSQGRGTMFGGVQERIAAIKIQTVFRSYLAKKALKALKALVKLQALVRGYLVRKQAARTLHSMQALIRAQATVRAHKSRFLPDINPRKSLEKFDDMNSVHSRRLSGNLDNGFDRSPKIVEIDTCRPKSRSSRSRISPSVIDSTEDSMNLSWNISSISIPDTARNFHDFDYRYSSTAQSTPRYLCIAPSTPAKSVCGGDGGFNCPNYMSNTRSFEAKVRSQSAPKQRPELGPRKRLPLSEVLIESRASLSGVGMQRSCARAQEVAAGFNFKSAVVDRLDRSLEFGRETERDYYLQRKW
ncbi:uncharacterized protein A4U43_C01F21360 [Asparagus officinalis]|uniref:DUF4005 domain-containing protein n=1 Tax=Asparagus officinalis TaxID=4686 RepID=A0A5P1FR22_ASPOF|nr:uncharacterized protein A4U43_C01F21360 [Asparagus officinalis]